MYTIILLLAWILVHGISVCWGIDGWFWSSVICLALTWCFLLLLWGMWCHCVVRESISDNIDDVCRAATILTLPMIIVERLLGGWLLGIFDGLSGCLLIAALIGDGFVIYRRRRQQMAAEEAEEERRRLADEAEKESKRQEIARRKAELRRKEEKEAAAKRKRQKDEEEILKIMRDRAMRGEALPANVGCMTPTRELHDAHAYD